MTQHAHNPVLQEIAKFASGLVLGDLISLIWLKTAGLLPMQIFGMTITQQLASASILFDAVVFIGLIYYGWHSHKRAHTPRERWFHYAVGTLLGITAILHIARIITGVEITIAGWVVPYWLNGAVSVLAGFLAYLSFRLGSQ